MNTAIAETSFMIEPFIARTRSEKREFVRLLNDFRKEYFKGEQSYDMTEAMLDLPAYERVIRMGYKHKGKTIAIAEICLGVAYGKPTFSVGTIFVKSFLRNNGIARVIYDQLEETAADINPELMFSIDVEQSNFEKYKQKFIDMGFTHYHILPEFDNGVAYKEPTYALFRDHHGIKSLRYIK